VDLHTNRSDIDLIIYGSRVARKCHSKLQSLLNSAERGFSGYEKTDLRRLYSQRQQKASMDLRLFSPLEQRKHLQGKFRGTDYYIRCVREWSECRERYGTKRYFPIGRLVVRGTISDATESIFTPSVYRLTDAQASEKRRAPTEIVSFRGRFCEQALEGERIRARGTLEEVVGEGRPEYRMVIGENPTDSLIVLE
jgi:predicted nucleotidyltransferase